MTPRKPFRARQALQLLVGFTISAASIWLLVRQVDLRQVGAVLSQANPLLLLLAACSYFVSMTLRALRWIVLLAPVKRLGLREVWPVSALGYAGNLVLPARLGEVLRAAVLRSRGVAMGAGLATIAAERMIDGLATVGLVLLTTRMLPASAPSWLISAGRIAVAIFSIGLLALWLMLLARPWVVAVLDRLRARFPILTQPAAWTLRFMDGLAVLQSPSLLGRVVLLTALAWVVSIAEYWLAMSAVGVRLSLPGATFSLSAIALSTAIPAAPGYLGTQELVGVTVLGLWNVPPETALAASLAFHVIEIVPIGIVGLVMAWREGLLGPRRAALPANEAVLNPLTPGGIDDAG